MSNFSPFEWSGFFGGSTFRPDWRLLVWICFGPAWPTWTKAHRDWNHIPYFHALNLCGFHAYIHNLPKNTSGIFRSVWIIKSFNTSDNNHNNHNNNNTARKELIQVWYHQLHLHSWHGVRALWRTAKLSESLSCRICVGWNFLQKIHRISKQISYMTSFCRLEVLYLSWKINWNHLTVRFRPTYPMFSCDFILFLQLPSKQLVLVLAVSLESTEKMQPRFSCKHRMDRPMNKPVLTRPSRPSENSWTSWATKKTLTTFQYTGWFIGILILAYQNPHIIG